jgi:hypothetical protein
MAHDVFISYSSQDKAVADAVCATLEGRKIRCWIAPRDVLAGQPYAESILNGINKSRVFVLVFSSDSNLSQQVLREVERAVSKGIPILPFRIADVTPTKSMELFLSATHWLDALTPPLEGHLQKLADNVEALLGVEVPPKSETELPVKIKNKGAARKSKVKPLYIIAGIVVVALCVFGVLQLTGAFKGSKSEPKINSSTSVIGSTSTGLPGNAPTSLSTSTSTITTTSTKSNPPITTATGVIDSSGQLSSGVSTTGVLNKGETKWYYFSAEAGDAVFAVLTKADNSASMQPWLELLGPDGAVITGSYGSTSYTIDRPITKAGKHTLRVRDYANTGGNYVLSFLQLSKSVNPLSSGVSLQGKLQIPGDVNWYSFDASVGDAVHAVLSKVDNSASLRPWLELIGPDGVLITGSYGSTSYTIDRAVTKAGKHILRVRDYANTGGNYVLSFLQLSKSVNPLTSGVSLQGKLQIPGDVNWYSFDANVGDAAYAVLTKADNNASMQPWLELLGPDGTVITGSYGSTSYTIDRAITKAGKHTLRVRDYANTGGSYVLSFMQLSKSVNPLTSGVSLQGQLKIPGDVNWYTFDAGEGDAVNAVLSEGDNSAAMQPWLELLGPDGSVITGSYGSVSYTIDRAIAKAGKYTLRVRDYANKGGNYVLSFNLTKKS